MTAGVNETRKDSIMTALRWLFALVVFAGFCFSAGPAQEKNVTLTRVKYDGLKQEILKHRGKVVVVDFWQTNCGPCVEALPHYIELQKQYREQGLVVITVSLDPADNPKKVARANEILNGIQSPLRNLILDEPMDVWLKKFEVVAFPFAYAFDRRGKWVRFRAVDYQENPKSYEVDIKKAVVQMLTEK
jgi:thiol-disulfide isomerase/thioredoxin